MDVESDKGIWYGIEIDGVLRHSGETIDMIKSQAAKFVGEEAAKMMYAAMTFDVVDVRPVIDIGQGWKKSI
jgi:hypothetical protein